jgi:hypothetical protein
VSAAVSRFHATRSFCWPLAKFASGIAVNPVGQVIVGSVPESHHCSIANSAISPGCAPEGTGTAALVAMPSDVPDADEER